MTAQIPDGIEIDGVRYALCGIAGQGLFEPASHDVETRPIHTGCWRGFVCYYAVRDGSLRLAALRLGAGSQIGGVALEEGSVLLGAAAEHAGGEYVFRWDALDVPFTGTLLAGTGFVSSTYVHMGFSPAWRFENVLRLTVEAGRVTAREDLSEEMARNRESIASGEAEDPDGDRRNLGGWISRTFGLGLERSFPEPKPPRREH